jgi:mannose-6-phosphate isomerase
VNLSPSLLAPVFVPRIWGSRSLAPLFERAPNAESIGEVWLTGDQCTFASGPLRGRTLGEAWAGLPREWTGSSLAPSSRIPLLVKFIFPDDKLSVQVHPDDEYARERESAAGGIGKTEMWYAVAAQPGAQLRLGLEPGVTPEILRQFLQSADLERCLSRLSVEPGDTFFVPAGSAHTIGPGMILCEVQQHSDITYRLFDYNRRQSDGSCRPLHIAQAMDVLRFGAQLCGRTRGVESQQGSLTKTYLAACPYFASEIWEFTAPIQGATCPERFELLILLTGDGRIQWRSESMPYGPGEAWLLPAALGEYQLLPRSATKLLRTYVPDLAQYMRELTENHIGETQRSAIIHS